MANELYPKLIVSVHDQRKSGFVRQDTIGTPHPIEKSAPSVLRIPENLGHRLQYFKMVTDEKNTDKKEKVTIDNDEARDIIKNKKEGWKKIQSERVPIRYIKGCPFIDIWEQEDRGYKPSPQPSADSILIVDGLSEFLYEDDPAKYAFLINSFYSTTNPDRPINYPKLYDIIPENTDDPNRMVNLDKARAQAKAMSMWSSLVTKVKGEEILDENRINGLASLLNITEGSAMSKLTELYRALNENPIAFVETIGKYQETVITEITHAMQYKLVNFEGNKAMGLWNNRQLELGKEVKGGDAKKIERLGELLSLPENLSFYTEMKNEIEKKKENDLK